MTVRYNFTEEDLILANQELAQTPEGKLLWSEFHRRHCIAGGLIGLGVWWLWQSAVRMQATFPILLLMVSIFIAVGVVVFGWIVDPLMRPKDAKESIKRALRDDDTHRLTGEYSREITEEGLVSRWSTGQETTFWSAIQSIIETPHHLYVQLSRQEFRVIPKHAFSSPQHQAEFLAQIERHRQAQGVTPSAHKQAWYQSKDQVS